MGSLVATGTDEVGAELLQLKKKIKKITLQSVASSSTEKRVQCSRTTVVLCLLLRPEMSPTSCFVSPCFPWELGRAEAGAAPRPC